MNIMVIVRTVKLRNSRIARRFYLTYNVIAIYNMFEDI